MKVATLVCRILLGLMFLVFGLNKLHPFLPTPPMPPGDAGTWATIMMNHHWMAAVGFLEAVGGLLLLAGRYVPLGLAILAPICVNILLFHLLLEPVKMEAGIALCALEIFLLAAYRGYFAGLFTSRTSVS